MDGMVYGYARVSSRDQNLARQIDALEAFGVKRRSIYLAKISNGQGIAASCAACARATRSSSRASTA